MKKVLILSSSLRSGSNSDIIAKAFERGARKAGNDVEAITLKDKKIGFCHGCLACQRTGKCVIKDDMDEIREKMRNADVIVFATPIYYYEMSGQMKTVLDRSNPLFNGDYKFTDIYFLATCADTDPAALDRAISGLGGWIACFERCSLKGVIKGLGLNDPKAAEKDESVIKEAEKMGEGI